MEDGWQQVRYGRRRQRTFAPPRDWSGGRPGWMDRAPPFSRRRRDQVPYPSRPAPRPGPAHFSGPQTRSYAAVVRRGPQRSPRRGDSSRDGGNEVRWEAAGPQLGLLIRRVYKVIRSVHHLQNVAPQADKPPPRMIARMVENLADMIRPAAPSQPTMDLIRGNARNWGNTTCNILRDHYQACLEDFLGDIERGPTTDWKDAFLVATRWAKRNLPRITREILEDAEAAITARLSGAEPPQPLVARPTTMQTRATNATGPATGALTPEQQLPAATVQRPPATVKPQPLVATEKKQQLPGTMISASTNTSQRDVPSRIQSDSFYLPYRHPDPQSAVHQSPPQESTHMVDIFEDEDFLLVPQRTASQLKLQKSVDGLQGVQERYDKLKRHRAGSFKPFFQPLI